MLDNCALLDQLANAIRESRLDAKVQDKFWFCRNVQGQRGKIDSNQFESIHQAESIRIDSHC